MESMTAERESSDHATLIGDDPAAFSPDALADRNELAFIAVERTRMPMVVSNPRLPDNPIVLANEAFLRQTGYSAQEVIGRNCRFLQGPRTDPAKVEEIRNSLVSGEDITVELLNYRKDGRSFWNQLLISPIRDGAGTTIYYFASQMDVTRRRVAQELEAEEHRLLREIDHRAKNALALVQGIVRLTGGSDLDAYKVAVQNRVDVLARAHNLLAAERWRDLELGRLIQHELTRFGTARASADGPPVLVRATRVQSLALLLHELIANVARHGALSVPTGALSVRWFQEGERTRITLGETGGPTPNPASARGFGLTMADAVARRQLGGDLVLDWKPDGLETHLTIAC